MPMPDESRDEAECTPAPTKRSSRCDPSRRDASGCGVRSADESMDESMDSADSPVQPCGLGSFKTLKRSPGQLATTPCSCASSPRPRPGSVLRVSRGIALVGGETREALPRCNVHRMGAPAKRREVSPGPSVDPMSPYM